MLVVVKFQGGIVRAYPFNLVQSFAEWREGKRTVHKITERNCNLYNIVQ